MLNKSEENRISIFYSYAHEDEHLRKKLEAHLALLRQQDLVAEWHSRNISAGTEWTREISTYLNTAQIILLLVSSSFIASKYCYSTEMARALERHEAGNARVIPIILRPVYWKNAPFSRLQALPTGGKPITGRGWHNTDEAFADVVQGIHKVVEELRSSPLPSPFTPSLASAPLFLFNEQLTHPQEFYGRDIERETLLNRTYRGASTSLIGPRKIGKTWLMQYLLLVGPSELGSHFHFVYLDATAPSCKTVAGFTLSVINELGFPLSKVSRGLSQLEKVIRELRAKNLTAVLCIDEFEGLSNRQEFPLDFFRGLRAMTQKYRLVLITASKEPLIKIVDKEVETSGFFNVFEVVTVKLFNLEEAKTFIETKSTQAGLTKQECEYLWTYGQAEDQQWSPLRLQLVGKMLLEKRGRSSNHPSDPHYRQQFEQQLEEKYRGILRQ